MPYESLDGLTGSAKVLMSIHRGCDDRGKCKLTLRQIAEGAGMTERPAHGIVSALVKSGAIKRGRQKNSLRSNVYSLPKKTVRLAQAYADAEKAQEKVL